MRNLTLGLSVIFYLLLEVWYELTSMILLFMSWGENIHMSGISEQSFINTYQKCDFSKHLIKKMQSTKLRSLVQ